MLPPFILSQTNRRLEKSVEGFYYGHNPSREIGYLQMTPFADYPKTVKVRSARGSYEWKIVEDHYAMINRGETIFHERDVLRVDPTTVILKRPLETNPAESVEAASLPVYRLGDAGPFGVPTKRIFLCAKEGSALLEHREELGTLGFDIDKEAAKPNCGWVRHASDSPEKSLALLDELRSMEWIDVIEPQFLMVRQSKSARDPRYGR